ncbi:hypothetical protein BZA70DRAFT_271771 [Myxozyma melibiosi]|uniref:Cytoplasmic tRNA 2-thiolation protein 2 n=1 Tax=Myxozyma melibiosi TaxID=54550 RepID=A0ABR1FCQ8_9ASCO
MTAQLCKRCSAAEAVFVSRKEPFCRPCFVRYIRGKERKQMAPYKVTYPPRSSSPTPPVRLLLALSLGASSVALLEMLVEHLRDQIETHRGATGFAVTAVHVDCSSVSAYSRSPAAAIDELRDKFGDICTFDIIPLDDFLLNSSDELGVFSHGPDLESYSFTSPAAADDTEALPHTVKSDILDKVRDRTSKRDLLSTIIKTLVVCAAVKHDSPTLLFGDTMSRLAERVLSLTAKGRGASIPASISDNYSISESVVQLFPMREIMRAEAGEYAAMQGFAEYIIKPAVTPAAVLRMMTIDDLLVNYFREIEAGFPSIVSTVVRTADKLKDTTAEMDMACAICGVKCASEPEKWLQNITVNTSAVENPQEPSDSDTLTKDKDILCYGCLVATKSASFTWPCPPRSTKEEIISQYEL